MMIIIITVKRNFNHMYHFETKLLFGLVHSLALWALTRSSHCDVSTRTCACHTCSCTSTFCLMSTYSYIIYRSTGSLVWFGHAGFPLSTARHGQQFISIALNGSWIIDVLCSASLGAVSHWRPHIYAPPSHACPPPIPFWGRRVDQLGYRSRRAITCKGRGLEWVFYSGCKVVLSSRCTRSHGIRLMPFPGDSGNRFHKQAAQ